MGDAAGERAQPAAHGPRGADAVRRLLGELDDAALEAFAAHVQPGSPLLFAELRHLCGALARVPEGAGALGSFDGEYLYFSAGALMAPELAEPIAAAGERALAALAPYETGSAYLNFTEHATDASAFYADADYDRLRTVRAAVDPDGMMVSNHQVPAA